jgi:hypothetical protein
MSSILSKKTPYPVMAKHCDGEKESWRRRRCVALGVQNVKEEMQKKLKVYDVCLRYEGRQGR